MKIHKAALRRLFTANDQVLDAETIFEIGQELSAIGRFLDLSIGKCTAADILAAGSGRSLPRLSAKQSIAKKFALGPSTC